MRADSRKAIPATGRQKMKTARLASAYASAIAFLSNSEYLLKSGAAKVLSAIDCSLVGRDALRTLDKIAEETANPTAPPELRRKLRLDVTTARCALGQ